MSLCFKWAPRHEGVLASGGIAPRILDLGTKWRWVVSFTPRPLYPHGKSPWYPLDRRLGGLRNRSGHSSEETNSQPLPELETPTNQPVAQRYTTELSWLPKNLVNNFILRNRSGFDEVCSNASFEVFTAVMIQVEVFWFVTPCSVVVVVGYQRFRAPGCLLLQDLNLKCALNSLEWILETISS
jgi:hypothetical protein